jgi:hypothetical protein
LAHRVGGESDRHVGYAECVIPHSGCVGSTRHVTVPGAHVGHAFLSSWHVLVQVVDPSQVGYCKQVMSHVGYCCDPELQVLVHWVTTVPLHVG